MPFQDIVVCKRVKSCQERPDFCCCGGRRGSNFHGRFSDQVLSGRLCEEAPRQGEQLLQVQRPVSSALHVVAVPGSHCG